MLFPPAIDKETIRIPNSIAPSRHPFPIMRQVFDDKNAALGVIKI